MTAPVSTAPVDAPGSTLGSGTTKDLRSRARPRFQKKGAIRFTVAVVSLAVVIGAWQLVTAVSHLSPIIMPPPSKVATSLWSYITVGTFPIDLRTSGEEFVLGYVCGCAAAIVLGVVIGYFHVVRWAVAPWLNFFIAVPVFALAPLMLVWLGVGLLSKVAIVFLSCLFPVIVNTISGVQHVDRDIQRMARSFGIAGIRYFRVIVIPGSIPYIVSGLRLAVGYGLIGVFVAELTGAQFGIGAMITNAGNTLDTARLFAGLLIFGTAGLVLTAILLKAEKRFSLWKAVERDSS